MSSETPDKNPASMLHGHAAYVAGAAKETIGTLTSSEPWLAAGRSDKESAIDEMRAAKDASGGDVTRNATVGKIEETVGKGVGCEGMVEEGARSKEVRGAANLG